MKTFVRDHLIERYVDVTMYNGVFIDEDEKVATFLLWDLSGRICGYQQYRPNADKKKKNHPREGRYYTFLGDEGKVKKMAVWGIESLSLSDSVLVIVEGVFDAVRLHNVGIPAIALLSSSNKPFRSWLHSLGRKIFKVSDDHASHLGDYPEIRLPTGRVDIGECTDEEIENMITTITDRGKSNVCLKKAIRRDS